MQTERRGVLNEIKGHTTGFALAFFLMFVLTFVFLAATDSLPNNLNDSSLDTAVVTNTEPDQASPITQNGKGELPVRVVSKKIGLDSTISNPNSTDVGVLDNALLKGGVRYPASAPLGVDGTVLLFGHSSYLPIVKNQNYKAFDGIQNLKEGDTISVYSGTTEYRYSVKGVRLATTDDIVELTAVGQHLALVTCDSFGSKSDRFVLTADLEGTYSVN
ncbi:MAG: Peptidase sortase-like protein [Candidatus Adlerbacteria bacterium]|nr:Peptidase sortase-like protein [Candidatus Adlerbacteria bacterium]